MIAVQITITFCEQDATSNKSESHFYRIKWRNFIRNSTLKDERRASPSCYSSVIPSLAYLWAARRGQLRPKAAGQQPPSLLRLAGFLPHCISWKIASQKRHRKKKVSASPVSQSPRRSLELHEIRSVNFPYGGTASSSGLFAPCWLHRFCPTDLMVFSFSFPAECRCRCRSADNRV